MVFRPGNRNGEERNALDRVLGSRAFAASPRLAQFLRYVSEAALEDRSDQINEYAVGLDVYERGKDFDPRLDSTVRVEARRLRKALERYYESEGADDPLRIVIPRGGYAPKFEASGAKGSGRGVDSRAWVGGIAATAMLMFGAWRVIGSGEEDAPKLIKRTPRQLTTDPGLSGWPDITPDGQWLVYASDRDGGPDLDLWIRHIDRDDARQLTDAPGDEIQPRFSPDGSMVVYTSTADRSVYVISATGGEPSLVADDSRCPRFSPDGRHVAFTRGRAGWSSQLFLADLAGERRALGESMAWLGAGSLWLPDGALLSAGIRTHDPYEEDWWIVPMDGSAPKGTGAKPSQLELEMVRAPPFMPQAWLEPEQGVLFSAREDDFVDLYLMPISVADKRAGTPIKVTHGAAMEYDAGASRGGKIVYSSASQRRDLWRLPVDANTGTAKGPAVRLTSEAAGSSQPAVSADGRVLVYLRAKSTLVPDGVQVLVTDLAEFAPTTILAGEQRHYRQLVLEPSGSRVYYEVVEHLFYESMSRQEPGAVYRVHLAAGRVEKLLQGRRGFLSVSPDEQLLLFRSQPKGQRIFAVDPIANSEMAVLEHETFSLQNPVFSPDGQWIAFHANTSGSQQRQVYVAPYRPGDPPPEEEWLAVAAPRSNSQRAAWSPDGALLYYISDQSGPYAIWAQRVDPKSMSLSGEPWIVYQGGGDQPTIHNDMVVPWAIPRLAITPDAIIFDVTEQVSNIWMLDPDE